MTEKVKSVFNKYHKRIISALALICAVTLFVCMGSEIYAASPEAYSAASHIKARMRINLTGGLFDKGDDTKSEEAAAAQTDGTDDTTTVKEVLNMVGTTSIADSYRDSAEEEAQKEPETAGDILDEEGSAAGAGTIFGRKTAEEYLAARDAAEGACWGYTNLGISDVSDNLNIRSIPAEDGKLVGKLPKDAACEVLETEGDWTHITSGEVDGYVKSEYLLTGLQARQRVRGFVSDVVKVGADGLRVREEPSTDAPIVTQVGSGEILDYVGTEGDWVAVMLDDETVYVSADYVEVTSDLRTALTMTEVLYGEGVSDVRAELCNFALQYVGNPYVWGGTNLERGVDCSGFTMKVFAHFGISLPHSSRAQANMGTTITQAQAQAGDLVFYGNGRRINHVGIYLGGGRVVHASNPRTGIRVSNVGYRTPVKFVRILYD